MENDFKEKLALYQADQLDDTDKAVIEQEVEKYLAISDFLDGKERRIIEELKGSITPINDNINLVKKIKKRINFRFVLISLITFLFCIFAIWGIVQLTSHEMDVIYNPTPPSTTKISDNSYVDNSQKIYRAVLDINDLINPYFSVSQTGSGSTGFSNYEYNYVFSRKLSNTSFYQTPYTLHYFLGKYTFSSFDKLDNQPFDLLHQSALYCSAPNDNYYAPHYMEHGFDTLKNLPSGTITRITVSFNRDLTYDELKSFSEEYNVTYKFVDTGFPQPTDKKKLESISEQQEIGKIQMGIQKDVNTWHNDISVINSKYNRDSAEFEKINFIAAVKFMKQNSDIANCFLSIPNSVDYNQIIQYIQKNGIQYIGVVVEGDNNSLLKLQNNPLVYDVSVNDVALW
jgi:hypothetical protein